VIVRTPPSRSVSTSLIGATLTAGSPDVIEYPDDETVGVFALTTSDSGDPFEAFFHAKDAFRRD
jgi:hypothetical protein